RLCGRHLKSKIVDERFEFLIPGDEIGFAVDLDQYPDLAAHMNVGMDQPLVGFAPGFLGRRREAFLPEIVDGLSDVVSVFIERLLTIQNAGPCFFTKLFHELTGSCHDSLFLRSVDENEPLMNQSCYVTKPERFQHAWPVSFRRRREWF